MKLSRTASWFVRLPNGAYSRRLIAAGSVFAIAAAAFSLLAYHVVMQGRMAALTPGGFDLEMVNRLHAAATPTLTRFMLLVSDMHSLIGIGMLSLLLAVYFYYRGEYAWLLGLLLAVPGGMIFITVLKMMFRRPRPYFENPLVILQTWSFPSGHTAGSTLFYGVLAAWLVTRSGAISIRATWTIAALAMVGLVASSRMYLGAHYPSDVVGGFLAGVAWLALCTLATQWVHWDDAD